VCAAAPAQAQTTLRIPPPPAIVASTTLTLEDAVREALEHNLTLVAERYSVSIARARLLTATLRPNPVLTFNAMLPDATVFAENISPREQVFRTDVLIERGSKRDRRLEVAEDARSVAELQLMNAVRTIALDVESAFVDVVLANANVALARESLQAFDSLVQVNVQRVRTGDLAQVELSRSRLAALQFRNDVRQQEAKLIIAQNRLGMLLGRAQHGPIAVSGEFRRDTAPVDLDVVRRNALRLRPDLEALRRDQARSTAEVRLQMAQGQVDYTVSGEVHHQHQATPPGDNAGFLYGLYLSVPLPLFNRNQGEIERARQEARQIEARIRALEADVTNEVQAAYESYAASRDVVDTIESQMLAQAREVRTTTEYSYRRGEASFVEFLDAARVFNETMQSYNEARAEYARSLYTLDSVSGVPAGGIATGVIP
jgi:cobalt-zinc-cadmium efflux system outer membrane protein